MDFNWKSSHEKHSACIYRDATDADYKTNPQAYVIERKNICDLGKHAYGSTVDVTVLPFRSCLVKLTSVPEKDPVTVSGIPYRIVNDRVGSTSTVKLLGRTGETYKYKIKSAKKKRTGTISFPGTRTDESPYRHIASMAECAVHVDAATIYYSTVYAADNNALEVRALERSGQTAIPEVKAARDARPFGRSMLTLDMGKPTELDSLIFSTDSEHSLGRLKVEEAVDVYVSADLKEWKNLKMLGDLDSKLDMGSAGAVRYLRFYNCPLRLPENGYLCIAINGKHGEEKAWAGIKVDGEYVGCPDRAPILIRSAPVQLICRTFRCWASFLCLYNYY